MNDAFSSRLETERFLHEKIPLTRNMDVRVAGFNDRHLHLSAALAPNHNHLGTAFGGSLAAIATLAGYTLLWLELGDRDSHIVIKQSSIRYLRPVRGDIHAFVDRLPAPEIATFREKFARAGKAGISLNVRIVEDDRVCVEFEGVFVAIR